MKNEQKIFYQFTDEIVFPIIMQDPVKCKTFLERLFPDRKVSDLHLKNESSFLSRATPERTIIPGLTSRGIRLDVLFEGSNAWYDIEMQVRKSPDLPKRTRYYHSLMDQAYLKKTESYKSLNPQYVIFICAFDPFDYGKPLYKFSMSEDEIDLKLGDESYTIFLNTKANNLDIPDELKSFYNYIDKQEVDDSDAFITDIHKEVIELNDDADWRDSLMTIGELMDERYDEGMEQGLNKGRTQGKNELLLTLIKAGKLTFEDAMELSEAPEAFEEMYRKEK